MRGFTRFTQERGDEAAADLASRFADTTREVVGPYGGSLLELRGDEALVVFDSGRQAIRAALELHARLRDASNELTGLPVGIGLDVGEAVRAEGGFRGGALNLAGRLCALATAEETLASEAVVHLTGHIQGVTFRERPALQLKGLHSPVRPVEVLASADEAILSRRDLETPVALATVMFTNIQRSTELAARLGDEEWWQLLDRYHAQLRDQVAAFGGRVIEDIGDGVLAVFERPANGVRCGLAILECFAITTCKRVSVSIRASAAYRGEGSRYHGSRRSTGVGLGLGE